MSVRLAHLMDQLEGALLSTIHAQESSDPIVADTVHTHARNADDIAHRIAHLVNTDPEAHAAFFAPSTNPEPTD